MSTNWESKFSSFSEALIDIILEGVLIAVWILVTFGISFLIKITIGRQFTVLEDRITSITLLLVAVIGSIELVISLTIRTYVRLRRELNNVRQDEA